MKNKITVLSLGGSLIIPKTGFDLNFLQNFKKLILTQIKKGNRFIIICGGGDTARRYQSAGLAVGNLSSKEADWIGIYATHLNAFFMQTIFKKFTNKNLVIDPTKKIKWTEPILIGAGWKPGCSTDYDAVLVAKTYGAKEIINLSNIEYVYDSDPKKNPKAKKLIDVSWVDFRKIVGNKWVPGSNLPFDPIASKEAEKSKMQVIVMSGNNLKEVEKAIEGKKFKGTTIK